MPTTQQLVTSVLYVAADLVGWFLLFSIVILVIVTIGPLVRHPH
jgi:hypothetical protein